MSAKVHPEDKNGAGLEEEAKEDKKEEKAEVKTVSVGTLFSLATAGDYVLLVMGVLGAVANGGSQPAMVYVWGRMIDSVGGGPDMAEQIMMMLIVAAATWVAATLQSACLRIFSQNQANRMRQLYFEAALNQDISWFDQRTVASLSVEIQDDCEKVATAFNTKFGAGIQGVAGFFIAMVLGFYMGWKLALVILVAVPFMAIAMVLLGNVMQEAANETQSSYTSAAALVEECLFALRTVVAFGGERRELAKYTAAVTGARKGAFRSGLLGAFGMGYIEFVWAGTNAAALYYGMTLVYNEEKNTSTGEIWTGGDIIIVFFTILIGGFSIGQLEPATKAINEAQVAAARFYDVYRNETKIQRRGIDKREELKVFESFQFRDVVFAYPARPEIKVLKGLNMQFMKGQKVAFVGESGSGKSTVMSLLERFYDPLEGVVLVNNKDLREFTPSSLRALIGYVGQEPVLFATSVRNNIMQGWPQATEADLEEATKIANMGFINDLPDKLDTFVGSGGSQFSGGQKQRIAIARAMLRKPKILFLDEATSALDNKSEKMIQETIDKIGNTGIGGEALTTVAIAHRLSTIKNCDMIFALKDGMVAEQGNHRQLMDQKGLYYGLAATQEMKEDTSVMHLQDADGLQDLDVQENTEAQQMVSAGYPSKTETESKDKGVAAGVLEKDKEEEERKKEILKKYSMPTGRLLGYAKPEWWAFVPGVLGALVHGANNPAQAFLLVGILDALYAEKEKMKEDVTRISIMFALLGLIVFLATVTHTISFGHIAQGMTMRLRITILTQVFRQEIGYHDDPKHTPGLIGTALQLWAYRVQQLTAGIEANAAVIASLFLGIAMAFYGSWRMTLVMIGAIPVLGIASSVQMAFMLGADGNGNEKIRILQQIVSDSIQNARTVHACGMENALAQYHRILLKEANANFVCMSIGAGFAFGLGLAAPMGVMAGGFRYSEYLVEEGLADFKGVMYAFMGIMYAAMGAGQAAAMAGDAAKAKLACHDMFQLIDRETQIDGLDPKGTLPIWNDKAGAAGDIEFQAVEFHYPFRAEVKVLKGVNFKIRSGQSVGLVGPSGGGKSTIMSLIQRFYDPMGGSVLIGPNRTDLKDIDIRWWRRQVGFVGQEPILFNTTVKKNVLYGLDEDNNEAISDEFLLECKKMAHLDFIDSDNNQGWETEVGPRGSRLSGGQKQRVAICRALVRNPAVLLLDEATSALDTESERIVQEALEAARQGRTSFAIAHRLSTIQDCDVILVAAEGVILESGSHFELMAKKGVYYKLQGNAKK